MSFLQATRKLYAQKQAEAKAHTFNPATLAAGALTLATGGGAAPLLASAIGEGVRASTGSDLDLAGLAGNIPQLLPSPTVADFAKAPQSGNLLDRFVNTLNPLESKNWMSGRDFDQYQKAGALVASGKAVVKPESSLVEYVPPEGVKEKSTSRVEDGKKITEKKVFNKDTGQYETVKSVADVAQTGTTGNKPTEKLDPAALATIGELQARITGKTLTYDQALQAIMKSKTLTPTQKLLAKAKLRNIAPKTVSETDQLLRKYLTPVKTPPTPAKKK